MPIPPEPRTDPVDRALATRRDEAAREVQAILDATLAVAARSAPASPRVADIVREAGTSNQAFYRYFSGKEDLLLAVMDRGICRLHGYLEHQMSKATTSPGQVTAWIEGMLLQVTDPAAAEQGAAIHVQLAQLTGAPENAEGVARLGSLLIAPLHASGSQTPELDARAIQDSVLGVLRRHARPGTRPSPLDQAHLIGYCLRGARLGRVSKG